VRQDGRTERGAGADPEERFKRLDRNGDGKITPDEMPRPELFKRLDRDGDGILSRQEADAFAGKGKDLRGAGAKLEE
jgi:hypothetical protein